MLLVDSSTLKFGVESDNTNCDFSPDEDEIYDETKSPSSTDQSDAVTPGKRAVMRKKMSQINIAETSSTFGLVPGIDAFSRENENIDDDSQLDREMDEIRQQVEREQNLISPNSINETVAESSQPRTEPVNMTLNTDDNALPGFENALPEDDEWELDRRIRLTREMEQEQGHLNRRLTAPPNEIRRRNRSRQTQSANRNGNSTIDSLREKQMQLVDLQIDLQKVLLENAKITQKETQEKYLYTKALRMSAEQNLNSNSN